MAKKIIKNKTGEITINNTRVNGMLPIKELINKTLCPNWCILYAGVGNASPEYKVRCGNMTEWPQTPLMPPKEHVCFSLVRNHTFECYKNVGKHEVGNCAGRCGKI